MVIKRKFWDNVSFFICDGFSQLLLFKVLSFLHTRNISHIHISENIDALTMKQVSIGKLLDAGFNFLTLKSARTDITSRKSI